MEQKEHRISQIATVVLAAVLLFGLSLFAWVKPQQDFSYSERRTLKKRPELSMESIFAEGDRRFMNQFEDYATDQFPLRERFRTLYSYVGLYGLAQKEINGIYIKDSHAVKVEYPLNQESLDWALERFSDLNSRYFKNSRVYAAVIPDKNYFLAEKTGHPALDYEKLFSQVREGTGEYAVYLELADLLSVSDYYRTDTHWRQERIGAVAERLCAQMGTEPYPEFTTVMLNGKFYGVYSGQAALPLAADSLGYLTNEHMQQLSVTCLDSGRAEENPLYDLEKAEGKDGYELFLSGSKALLVIENPNAASDRELVIFRDSFGSSLAPLLTNGYRKVTLVDIRYLSPQFVGNFVNFDGADVLLLYSTTLLNDAKNQLMK